MKMNKKLYYTSHRVVTYMANEFGVELEDASHQKYLDAIAMARPDKFEVKFEDASYQKYPAKFGEDKYYIHPNSYHVFKRKQPFFVPELEDESN